jgi:membrane-bound lytic murein transglycosylase D
MNPANSSGARDHYVAPGDSLWKISRLYKVPVESIKQANGMTNDTVILGKKLIIPAQ